VYESWSDVVSYSLTAGVSWSVGSVVVETETVFATVVGTTVTALSETGSVVEVQTATFGITRYQTMTAVPVIIPIYVTVRSRVVVRLRLPTTAPDDPRPSDALLIGAVSGAAAVLCILAGMALAIVRARGGPDSAGRPDAAPARGLAPAAAPPGVDVVPGDGRESSDDLTQLGDVDFNGSTGSLYV
jgi:hypothetical protein